MRHTEEQPYDIDELWPDEAELGAMLRSHYRRHPSPQVMAAHLLELRQVAEAERPRSIGGRLSRSALIGSVAACLLIAGLVLVGPLRSRTETTGEDNTDTPTTGLEAPANEVDSGPGPQSINDNRSTSPVTGRIESDSGPRAGSDGNTDTDTDTNGGSDSRTGTDTGSDAIAVFDRTTKPATTIGATPPSIASSPVPTPVSTTEPTPSTPKPSDLETQQTGSAPASQSSTTESSITAPSTTLGTAITPTTTTSAVDTTAPPTTSAPTTTPPTTAPPTTSPPTTSPPTTSQSLLCLLPVIRILCI